MRAVRRVAAVALTVALGAAAAGCSGDDEPGPSRPSSTTSSAAAVKPAKVTFAVWGSGAEVATYQQVVDAYDAAHPEAVVTLKSYPTRADLVSAIEGGTGDVPDLYMIDRGDLADVLADRLNRPVGDLLDERDVDLGDQFSRPALEAFASERQLQCMPYGISPMVMYYNTALVDFDKMTARGLDVPNVGPDVAATKRSWSLDQFQTAAKFASRPRKGIAGFYVAPTLRGLAPFIYAAGGSVFDDDDAPTSLAFSSGDTQDALQQVLPVLADARETLTAQQLAQKTPLQWFEQGKLGMIAGFRDLVPELRKSGIDFDVMPMPSVDGSATVGDLTGICLSRTTKESAAAADFLSDFISTDTTTAVAQAGYLAPANLQVALSDGYLQPDQMPASAGVFDAAVKNVHVGPLLDDYDGLEAAVSGPLDQLLQVATPDIDALTQQIDLASQSVLAPPPTETPSPDGDTSESPSSD